MLQQVLVVGQPLLHLGTVAGLVLPTCPQQQLQQRLLLRLQLLLLRGAGPLALWHVGHQQQPATGS